MPAYDPRTALLVVDVQHDFADAVGSLYVRGAEEIVPLVNDEVASAVDAGALVVYTQDWHPESTPHFEKDGGIWPVHCVQDTWGAEFHADLQVVEDAPVIRKGTRGEDGYSAVQRPRPAERRIVGDRTRHAAPRSDDPTRGHLRPHHRLLRRRIGLRRAARHLDVDVVTAGIRAVDLRSGDGQRALERMRDVGAVLV